MALLLAVPVFLVAFGIYWVRTANAKYALNQAVISGDVRRVKQLLDDGKNVNGIGLPITPLMWAAAMQRGEITKLLLDKGAQPDVKNSAGLTAFDFAIDSYTHAQPGVRPDASIVPLLLAHGANANGSKENDSPLIQAVRVDDVGLMRLLLAHGAQVNAACHLRNTALHHAALRGNVEAVKVLLAAGADPNSRNSNDDTPLHAAVLGGNSLQNLTVIHLLEAHGAQANQIDKKGATPFHFTPDARKVSLSTLQPAVSILRR